MKKVSVVIPLYNVCSYIRKCLDSVLGQTYENLEIICIDDGSGDGSGEILDQYGMKDGRMVVVHQENKGLAEVRNIGKNMATGEYLLFVDSDDYIEKDMIKKMVAISEREHADIVCCGFFVEYADGRKYRNCKKDMQVNYTRAQALGRYLYTRYVNPVAWGKLYRTSLLQEITYPRGKLYEDMNTTYRIIAKAEIIVYDTTPFYHYLQRGSSIGRIADKEKNMQLQTAVDEYWNSVRTDNEIAQTAGAGVYFWLLVVYNHLILAGETDCEIRRRIADGVKVRRTLLCPYLSLRKKLQLLLFVIDETLYRKLYMRYSLKKVKIYAE